NPILAEFGNQAYAGAPLLADSEVLGVFFAMHREPHVYTQNELAFLQALANRGAAAIQKVRLFQELQRSRDQLAQRSAELQERVEEVESLNRALTNLLEDLQAANRRVARTIVKLEAANQELESFTYSVSHDLRAPLRAMQGFADALLEDYGALLDETGQEFAWRIVAAARRMDELINDLLQYSRLVRMDVHTTDVSMEDVVQVVLEELQASIAETHARVQVDRPLPQVRGHRRLLQQIIGNLVSNALKFTQPETPPQVRIWAETTKDKVRLWVEDQGIGIEPAHRERIFRIFERLHGIESYPGTGVGLAIVKRAVERLGGRVGVESTPGAGSRFWVELPGVGGDKVTR
ncbi:MAG: GAF domain-containing protein, partial [Caldilineae bacterium]